MVAHGHAFGFTVDETAGTLRIAIEGELDYDAFASSEARNLLTRTSTPRVIHVDLSALTFLDSAGVNFLLQLRGRANELGATMSVVNVPAVVLLTLQHTGLIEYLDVGVDPPRPD